MNWLLTAILCLLLAELVLRLPFGAAVIDVSRSGRKAVHVVRTKAVSDHWKEKALAAYAQTTFLSSIKLAGLLTVLFTVAVVLVVAFEQSSRGFNRFIVSWHGIGFSVIFASLYLTARKSIVRGRI